MDRSVGQLERAQRICPGQQVAPKPESTRRPVSDDSNPIDRLMRSRDLANHNESAAPGKQARDDAPN